MYTEEIKEIHRIENLMRINGHSESEINDWRRTNINAQIMRSNRLKTRINYIVLIFIVSLVVVAVITLIHVITNLK